MASLCLTRPETRPEKRPRKPWVHALTRDGARAASQSIHYTRLQVVQRSLSGGYLTEDAALLNANARSMFDRRDPPEPYGAGRPK